SPSTTTGPASRIDAPSGRRRGRLDLKRVYFAFQHVQRRLDRRHAHGGAVSAEKVLVRLGMAGLAVADADIDEAHGLVRRSAARPRDARGGNGDRAVRRIEGSPYHLQGDVGAYRAGFLQGREVHAELLDLGFVVIACKAAIHD